MLQIKSVRDNYTSSWEVYFVYPYRFSDIFGDTWHIRIDWYAVTFDINLGILEETDML